MSNEKQINEEMLEQFKDFQLEILRTSVGGDTNIRSIALSQRGEIPIDEQLVCLTDPNRGVLVTDGLSDMECCEHYFPDWLAAMGGTEDAAHAIIYDLKTVTARWAGVMPPEDSKQTVLLPVRANGAFASEPPLVDSKELMLGVFSKSNTVIIARPLPERSLLGTQLPNKDIKVTANWCVLNSELVLCVQGCGDDTPAPIVMEVSDVCEMAGRGKIEPGVCSVLPRMMPEWVEYVGGGQYAAALGAAITEPFGDLLGAQFIGFAGVYTEDGEFVKGYVFTETGRVFSELTSSWGMSE